MISSNPMFSSRDYFAPDPPGFVHVFISNPWFCSRDYFAIVSPLEIATFCMFFVKNKEKTKNTNYKKNDLKTNVCIVFN